MNKTFKNLVALVALCSTAASTAVPYITPRSDSVNAARDMVGWEEFIHLCDMESIYGAFSITPEFKQTFHPNRITRCLFGIGGVDGCDTSCNNSCGSNCNGCCGNVLKIQGSTVANRDANAWFADYFGLPTDYSSEISFCPQVRTGLVDLSLYLGLDSWANGLYFRIHAPIVHSRWSLNFNETLKSTKGSTAGAYTAGYFSDVAVPTTALLSSATAFFSGNAVPTLAGTTANKFEALKCSRWNADGCNCNGMTLTRLSDIEAALGWNFYCDEDYAVGLSVRASAPTGNKVNECYLFAPVIGQGGNWKLGGGLDAHAIFWRSEDENKSFGFYLEANVQHLFKACQTRCFDLCIADGAGENSRYMLAEKLTASGTNQLSLAGSSFTDGSTCPDTTTIPAPVTPAVTLSQRQFDASGAIAFTPVANLTTTQLNVDAAVEGDVALKFAYTNGGFGFDFGYEFWGRSCERFCKSPNCGAVTLSDWALKGDAFVYGYTCGVTLPGTVTAITPSSIATGTPLVIAANQAIALAPTESKATINSGTSLYTSGLNNNTNPASANQTANGVGTNLGINDAQYAYIKTTVTDSGTPTEFDLPLRTAAGLTPQFQTRTSIQPIMLSDANVNYASTKGISNKLFMHFSYAWNEREDWMPFLGIGGEVEWSGGSCDQNCDSNCGTSNCSTTCNTGCSTTCGSSLLQGSCQTCAFNQWGVWAKLGIAFN